MVDAKHLAHNLEVPLTDPPPGLLATLVGAEAIIKSKPKDRGPELQTSLELIHGGDVLAVRLMVSDGRW